MAVDYNP